ncbi:Hemolysin [Giardia duodenalis assemblage B]|uniref:Hemolysin n=2 Tax=Giardia intestinalis TaxID=5741 RepID=A0A132NMP5_GIAIN|nr:Hemolysin [Giardia intestinalis assemblage B]
MGIFSPLKAWCAMLDDSMQQNFEQTYFSKDFSGSLHLIYDCSITAMI